MPKKPVFVLKKTVLAVLDSLVNPHWPYMPDKLQDFQLGEISDCIERAWSSVPEDPKNYYFRYHLLDADEQGRQPKIEQQTVNKAFDEKSISCLRHIAECGDKVNHHLTVHVNISKS